jgi:hypothetical protein
LGYPVLLCILFSSFVAAQEQDLGCGPKGEKLKLIKQKGVHPTPSPSPGKALVYVMRGLSHPLMDSKHKVAVNGKWVGMTVRRTYFYFEADPGLLRLCEDQRQTPLFLTAEAGKTYYVITQPMLRGQELIQVSEEEGRKRLEKYDYATVKHKK